MGTAITINALNKTRRYGRKALQDIHKLSRLSGFKAAG